MILYIALAVLYAPLPSLCLRLVNMTLFNELNRKDSLSEMALRTGRVDSNSTCTEALLTIRTSRTPGAVFIKNISSFDNPGFSICLAGIYVGHEGALEKRSLFFNFLFFYFTLLKCSAYNLSIGSCMSHL